MALEFVEDLHLQHPLRALDLVGPGQGISKDIVPTHDELRGQNYAMRLRPMEDPLRNVVQKRRMSLPPRVPKGNHHHGVVGKDGDCGANDQREKVKETALHRQELPSIDREGGVLRRPPARNDLPS